MLRDILTQKLINLGFTVTQPEFATKDKFFVDLDNYPFTVIYNKTESLEFTMWCEFVKFYNVNKEQEFNLYEKQKQQRLSDLAKHGFTT
jgi:hypothetical protein